MTRHRMTGRLPIALAALAVAAAAVVPAAQGAPQTRRSFVLYAKPTRARFVDRASDRKKGDFTNPFADVLPTPKGANTGKKGARAGDSALFTLRLYSDARLTRPVGTAAYSCTVNFNKQAICEGQFTLSGGTMLAMGPADLTGGDWILPVTGGTSRYAGAHGQLTSTTLGQKNTQILRFQLV
jgi:hypothetical protein